ncbi:translocation protein SEC63 [Nematocida sp. AWRm77]|nr:translocation protein SEC63 [Nematocida sp. AWRm77]
MNNKYEYDTSGVSSSLLAVGLLLPVLLATAGRAFSRERGRTYACACKECGKGKKARGKVNMYRVVFILACAMLVLPLRTIFVEQYGRTSGFDPYEILGIDRTCFKKKEIEKAYMVKARQAKLRGKGAAESKKLVQEVINAYQIVSDSKKRENWDMFGNMDVKEAHVIAIPKWAMTKGMSSAMLLAYILVLGLGVPKIVSLMWRYSFDYSSMGVSYATTESFYHKMKGVKRCSSMYALVEWIAEYSTELKQVQFKTPEENLKRLSDVLRKEFALPVDTERVEYAYLLCLAVLCLRNAEVLSLVHEDDVAVVQSEMLKCTKALRVIGHTLKLKDVYYLSYDLERCISQTVCSPAYWETQYTDVSFETVFMKAYEGKRTEEEKTETDKQIDARMFQTNITAIDMYTPLDGVVGRDESISGSADLSLRAVLTRESEKTGYVPLKKHKKQRKEEFDFGDLSVLGQEECPEINPKELEKHPILIRNSTEEVLHAPFFREVLEYSWVMVIEVNGHIVAETPEFTPGVKDTEVLFRLPPLQTFTPSGMNKALVEVYLISKRFFNRDSVWKKTLALA